MHPLDTERRRQLLAASLRLERCLKRERRDAQYRRRARIARLLRGGKPWDETSL